MLYLVTAMHCEAGPFLREFKLKRDSGSRPFEVYRGEDVALIVGGIGKIKSAIASTALLCKYPPQADCCMVNIGVCGSWDRGYSVGTPVLMHKIRDRETGMQYYPDMIIAHELTEGALETCSQVMTREKRQAYSDKGTGLLNFVDMEASGFFQAAQTFLGPHQIHVIKVVSDHMDGTALDREFVTGCMEKNLKTIMTYLTRLQDYFGRQREIITAAERQILERLADCLRLTVTQTHQLYNMARLYKIRTGAGLPDFSEYMTMHIKTKNEGRAAFERIRWCLSPK